MGILARVFRFLLWLIVFVWAAWLARKVLRWIAGGSAQKPAPTPPSAHRQLYRDPVCGTHVPSDISFTLEESGQVHHFCSAECREKFRALRGRAASA